MYYLIIISILFSLNVFGFVGGIIPEPNSFLTKQVVFIETNTDRCTGTFISKNIVLTVAHCFVGSNVNVIRIKIGQDLNNPIFITHGIKLILNSYYRGDAKNDLALVKTFHTLPDDFPITEIAKKNYYAASQVVASGYGYDNYSSRPKINKIPQLRFVNLFKSFSWWPNGEVEVNINSEIGVSTGDSGGPLFIFDDHPVQIGVAHGITYSQNGIGKSVIYSDISSNHSWIQESINKISK